MSYAPLAVIPKADRLKWSEERGGRMRQRVGKNWVRKFSFSPFTAKAKTEYSFYADIETVEAIGSPSGKAGASKTRFVTLLAFTGTYLEFRDEVKNGLVEARLAQLVDVMGGGQIASIGYWRNRGERRVTGENP